MNAPTDLVPSEKAIATATEAENIIAALTGYVIADDFQYTEAGGWLKRIKYASDTLDTERREMTKPIDESKKRIMDWFRTPIDALDRMETALKRSMLDYKAEERRKAEAEQARLRAEKQREIDAQVAAMQFDAVEAEAAGDNTAALGIEIAARRLENVPATIRVEPEIPKIAGQSVRKLWKYRVRDLALVSSEYMIVNDAVLSALARAVKGTTPPPAGIEWYSEDVMSSTRG